MSADTAGNLVLSHGRDGKLHVDHADPCVVFGAHFLSGVDAWPTEEQSIERPADGEIVGSVLRINGINRKVVYVITDETPPDGQGWVGRWPD